jgi:hypothetical protein
MTNEEIARSLAKTLGNPRALHERATSHTVLLEAAANLPDASFSDTGRQLAHEMCTIAFLVLCPKLPAGFSPQIGRLTGTFREIQKACAAAPAPKNLDLAYQRSGQPLLAQGIIGIGRLAMADNDSSLPEEDLTDLAITVSAFIKEISQAANPG